MNEPWLRRAARRTLILGVRGRSARGSEWGEALIGEFEETSGSWDAVRWTLSGLRAARRTVHVPRSIRIRRRAVVAVVALAVVGIPANAYAAGVVYIATGTMEPTLRIDDRVVIDKLSLHWTGLRYGDIVVMTEGNQSWIRRIIGLPGDDIDCRDGAVFRNGAKVDEAYLATGATTDCSAVTVPAGQIYVLGDNRIVSRDSRQLGTFDAATVTGRVLTRIGGS